MYVNTQRALTCVFASAVRRIIIRLCVLMIAEKDRIRHRITDMYSDFVQQVDPKGNVMDYLIQKRILNDEVSQRVLRNDTKQERCRAMLHELLSSGNTRAFIVLREALERSVIYHYIVENIDKETEGNLTTI